MIIRLLIALLFTTPAIAHEKAKHGSSNSTEQIHVFEKETLRISNVPVTDINYNTQGFINRFAKSGTLILSFTYTNCETQCPITNAILAAVDAKIADERLTIVSISIDPKADTPSLLNAYAKSLDSSSNWVWLTATESDNRILLDNLGVDTTTLQEHDPTFLIGDVCTNRFTRVIGIPEPDALLTLARAHAPCGT